MLMGFFDDWEWCVIRLTPISDDQHELSFGKWASEAVVPVIEPQSNPDLNHTPEDSTMQLTYRGARYATSSVSAQAPVEALGTYRGTQLRLGPATPAQPVAVALRYRGISYQAAE